MVKSWRDYGWELVLLTKRGSVRLNGDLGDWVRKSFAELNLREAAFTAEVALELPFVQLPHKDPGDRFMVATARAYDLTLVTNDSQILAAEQHLQLQLLPNR